MLINNVELSSLGVKLFNRVISSNKVATKEDWLEGDIQPTYVRQQDGFKSINLEFLVLTGDEDDAFLKISKLTQMLKKASIKFDDLDYVFDVSMIGKAEPDRLNNGNFVVKYKFISDYAKGEREVYTTNSNLTNAFKLTVLYYQDSTTLISNETITLRASAFEDNPTFESIGIEVDKYKPNYYNSGIATNLGGKELTYENLQNLGTLIINYAPIVYHLTVSYMMDSGTGLYNDLVQTTVNFTYPQLQKISSIGQLIDSKTYKPDGYKGRIAYDGELTVENLLAVSPIYVFYDKVEDDVTKTITVVYHKETDNGYELLDSKVIIVKDSEITDGMTLGDVINVDSYKPEKYYNSGYIVDNSASQLITFEELNTTYEVRYAKTTNTVFVEYYVGVYPGWYRLATTPLTTTYQESYETDFSLSAIGLDLNKYHTNVYYEGQLYNGDNFDTYESVIQAGVLQVYYRPIDYTIKVHYSTVDDSMTPVVEDIVINALDFMGNPVLSDIIPLTKHRPEGYQFSSNFSYDGEITLSALTQNSPIIIKYEEIQEVRTKNIILKYKQELSSAFATINTSIITINEADCQGGVRLKDIFNMNLYKPEYYEDGIIDGESSTALMTFESIQSYYIILYMASTFTTPVRYYLNEVNDKNWVGSSSITYKITDFTTETTLYDLGFSINLYKPSYCGDGELQYTGPINFQALREIESIDVVYTAIKEPEDEDGIDYPHRFLFLEHNDLGDYENLHPNWTMNHAYINTGVSCMDMSKLTVVMEVERVDENVPLHNVIQGYGYLFGSSSPTGNYFIRFNNQIQYGNNLTGVNTYEAQAGLYSDVFVQAESTAIGFSENTGIYSIERKGYSSVIFTYTNSMPSESAQMPYPLYLFANNNAGKYADGIAGVGIYGCRIYYDGNLIRDFIPVAFYDKIGDQVAPSNCLYDKITKTFFEDGTGQNSFNIRDDERYEDTNLEHKIGSCYVNYYKGDILFQTNAYYFRASDFVDKVIDPYEKFQVDKYQPAFYKTGKIDGFSTQVWDFDNMNNNVYSVIYEEQANTIVVNYYQNDDLIKTETIGISEQDFYQAPTFGDIVRINKYKPEGYETDFVYEGLKVSLPRIVENSPYNIVYRPAPADNLEKKYTTVIRYIKKVYGIRTYEVVGTKVLEFDETMFRDGEYIDFYIDKNLFKPEKYYKDGKTYEWYEMDERLPSPDKLLPQYTIWYEPDPVFLNVNYYKDTWEESSLIASTDWSFKIDDFEPGYPINLVDTLPNEYINKYKPANCNGGMLQNPGVDYDFNGLAELEEIAIIYKTKDQPHDPTDNSYEQKILYWGEVNDVEYYRDVNGTSRWPGARIPWIDLGFKPKDISRMRVEIKGYARPWGISCRTSQYGFQDLGFTYFFGYYGYEPPTRLGTSKAGDLKDTPSANGTERGTDLSPYSSGMFGFRCRVPVATGWVYSAEGPQYIDGQVYYTASSATGVVPGEPKLIKTGMYGNYRKGKYSDFDDNYNVINGFGNYGYSSIYDEFQLGREPYVAWWRDENSLDVIRSSCGDPYTMILDVYNKYGEIYRDGDSNTPITYHFDESEDNYFFENICQPQGSLTLFTTRNPDTGKINLMPVPIATFPYFGISGSLNLSGHALGNPYSPDFQTTISQTVMVQTGVAADGSPIMESKVQTKNIKYADFKVPVYPTMTGCAIWSVKIYDRDRLVRDLIPVRKGDLIYNYVAPYTGLFDKETEIFFGNSNEGGIYDIEGHLTNSSSTSQHHITIEPEDVIPLYCILDPTIYGKSVSNYYDYDNSYIDSQFVDIPTWFNHNNDTIENILHFNDYKPDDFHLDGLLDIDVDLSVQNMTLRELYEMNVNNIYYKLRQFTKTVVYYRGNVRIASKDLFYSLEEIDKAETLADLGIDVDLYYDEHFKHGKIVFDETIISSDDIRAFIDAPSPIVVYDKLDYDEAPNLLYVEYYRGGAYEDGLITIDEESPNYLNCNLEARVLNPHGAIKYYNHYHTALYEDEKFDYFIPYQVKVINKYAGIHRGPARKYQTLAMIIERDTYTIIEERNGWGRLKEYPIGWILLNQTVPMTGPGQNPDFDVPGEDVATIPFGDTIKITKLTVDRLWAYCPEYESWIKAEDLSYTQAGKLYNGLKIEVINLEEIDWSNCSKLSDVGIYPQKWKLRFHNYSDYTYTGEYTYEAFSRLHSIDIVYDETIYTYSCIYYQYYKANRNELGRSAFSCCISDWHPDWDKFIETSWRVGEIKDYGFLYTNPPEYQRSIVYSTTSTNGEIIASYYGQTLLRITGDVIQVGSTLWYPVEDTNGKNAGYIPNRYRIVKPYGGSHQGEIDPILYRDTELTLTWDYFGFDRNLFKPLGCGEGIYMWNSRTWDKTNQTFTFQELVRCGTQYVFYPCFEPDTYKIWIQKNYLGKKYSETSGNNTIWCPINNKGIQIDLSGSYNEYIKGDNNDYPIFDIYTSMEIQEPFKMLGTGINTPILSNSNIYYTEGWNSYGYWYKTTTNPGYFIGSYPYSTPNNYSSSQLKLDNPEIGDTIIFNFSNYRNSPTAVIGFANSYLNKEPRYYIQLNNKNFCEVEWERISENTNLKDHHLGSSSISSYELNGNHSPFLVGVIYDTISYENFMMTHYWVPVPKGLWYVYDGEDRRIPDNGLFDLLTGNFARSYRVEDGPAETHPNQSGIWVDGKDLIFKRNQEIDESQAYYYFKDWHYQSNECNYYVSLTQDTQSYSAPDEYATKIRKLKANLRMPITKYTSDSSNKVVGEWYFSGGQWFKSSSAKITSIYPGMNLVNEKQTICLVPLTTGDSTFYTSLVPGKERLWQTEDENGYKQFDYGKVGKVIPCYATIYNSDDGKPRRYFDGNSWIRVEYTHNNYEDVNINYVAATEVKIYEYPIEDNEYYLSSYYYGDRLTALRATVNDPDWLYTGIGWIKRTSTNLSLVE